MLTLSVHTHTKAKYHFFGWILMNLLGGIKGFPGGLGNTETSRLQSFVFHPQECDNLPLWSKPPFATTPTGSPICSKVR